MFHYGFQFCELVCSVLAIAKPEMSFYDKGGRWPQTHNNPSLFLQFEVQTRCRDILSIASGAYRFYQLYIPLWLSPERRYVLLPPGLTARLVACK